jgi:ABC-type transport system involved in multi-copper enzyme maturation permease subunit
MKRLLLVAGLEAKHNLRRPLFLILILIIFLSSWGLTTGNMRISSGDATVGGKQAWITSDYASTLTFCFMTILFYAFFVAVAAGMSILRDDELKIGDVLHTTGLKPGEYVWGKFAGVLASFLFVLVLHVLATIFCQYVLPVADAEKIRGPFGLLNYLRPALGFALPLLLFLTGVTLLVGEVTRRPIVIFLFPVALVLFCAFFLWDWDPEWLDVRWNRLLILIDPTAYRWLNETHIKVDRGVDFYNTVPVKWDTLLVANRLLVIVIGLVSVVVAQSHFARTLRGRVRVRAARVAEPQGESRPERFDALRSTGLAQLGMRPRAVGFLRQALTVAGFEFRGLVRSPGLYLFVPLILMQTIVNAFYAEGLWGTRLIVTPGAFAVGTMNTLTLCTVLLLLFYTVESLDRERASGLGQIYASTPVRTSAILFGKALANCFVGAVILGAAGLGAIVIMLIQHRVAFQIWPFLLVWGALLVPTFLLWCGFVIALMALVRNKYTTYGLALGVLILTGVQQMRGKMNWVWNWDLWSVIRWSDMGLLEPNGWPLLLNRLLYLSAMVFWFAVGVLMFVRREPDPTRVVHRLAPAHVGRSCLRLVPYAVAPLALAIVLGVNVQRGFQSKPAERRARNYWKQNLATWKDARKPDVVGVDLEVSLEPRRHSFATKGSCVLANPDTTPMREIALTLGQHTREARWTLGGADFEPEDRSKLYVFKLPAPLAQGDTVRVGFAFHGRLPDGVTKNGQGMGEFIEPSGVVLTSFSPSFAPVLGFDESIGVKRDENQYEPRVYPDDFYKTKVRSGFGVDRPYRTRIRLDAPAEYALNSVGTRVEEHVENGRRFALWESDQPVNFFNVIAGKWAVHKGEGTAIYHHPGHEHNIPEMARALDGSRRYYSEWFHPFPWQELKLSQFANLATYAQGFPTNITFSEAIGFLTLSDARSRMAFTVTAHEAAHQWWGNMLVPGEGPGGNILSEGMSHFSTILLHEQMNGMQGRIEFAKRIEERYGNGRRVDAERPLVKIDGSKEGDETVTYDKGGWVFWMLHDLMGRPASLAGLRAFMANHLDNPDHPQLEDFVAEVRPFAPDTLAYDAFTKQWFFEVVVPEYRFEDVKRVEEGAGWVVTGTLRNAGSGRMPVEVAATREDRFSKQSEEEALAGPAPVAPDYREARALFTLGAGDTASFRLTCDFEPQNVVVDPDARVLQLRRKYAAHRF